MREVSPEFLAAVNGSNSPVVEVDFWLGADLVREGMKPVAGVVEFSAGRDVEGVVRGLKVLDTEHLGSRLSETIHAIGMKVNVRAGFDVGSRVETVSMGWFDIFDTDRLDSWHYLSSDPEAPQLVKTSAVSTVEAFDGIFTVARSKFLEPTQPEVDADAWGTIADLCAGVVSTLDPGFTPKTIPAGIVFSWDRLDAIKQIAGLWDAFPVMTPDGQLTLTTDDGGDEIDDFGVRINLEKWRAASNSMSLYNGVAVIGKTPEGEEIYGSAVERTGVARWGGNFGMRPLLYANELMQTQEMVNDAAQTRMETEIKSRSVTQSCGALWNPAVELRDRMMLRLPDLSEPAQLVGCSLPLTGGSMTVDLRLPMVM